MIKEIQYLRGVACLLVVFTHYRFPYLDQFNGSIGVDIFFVISGFIIAKSADNYINNPNKFIINRLIRIYPIWLILCAVSFISLIVFSSFDKIYLLESLILSPLFIGEFTSTYSEPIIFSGWSLKYEVLFYLLMFVFLKFSKNSYVLKTRIFLILSLLGVIGLFVDLPNAHLDLLFSSFYLHFAAGVFIQLKYDFIKSKLSFNKIHLILSSILIIFVIYLNNDFGYSYIGNAKEFINIDNYGIYRRFFIWGIPSIIFFIVFTFSNLKDSKFLMFFGNISYSLYLIHTLLIPFAFSNKLIELTGFDSVTRYAITIVISIILSYFSMIYIEKKFSNYLKKLLFKI
ncbi:MAG: hypothetical protein CMC86_05565 [Flavobacteriaceae bacterium]|nr:hypothetical protein [Flavobacteriaceae bacterium]|tara:strand:+ start:10373 stop:11401 length:1029 start_codon:yes stop_codon:yes gene_type:complete